MRIPLTIARNDLVGMFREKETLLWLFFMPPLFFWFLGTVMGGNGGGDDHRDRLAVVVPADAGFLADRLIAGLERSRFHVERAADAAAVGPRQRSLVIPGDYTGKVQRGERAQIEWRRPSEGDDDLSGDYDRIRAMEVVYVQLAEVAMCTLRAGSGGTTGTNGAPALDAAAFAALDQQPRTLQVRVEAAGNRVEVPSGFQQSIPGSLVMFTLTILLTGGGVPLVVERRLGLLRRLASAPLSRGQLVFGKVLSRLLLAAVQLSFGLLLGAYAFGLDWGPDRAMLLLVLAAWGCLCAMLGIVVGNLARNEGQAVGLGVGSALTLAALGGCWWPIEITPRWMQQLAACLPTGWTMHAVHQLVTFRNGAGAALGSLALLVGATAVAGWLAARTFRYHG